MLRVGGADGAVDPDVQLLPLRAELRRDHVGELLGRFAGSLRGAFHLLAVLIRAGEHHGVVALHALETRDGFSGHGGVSVADVGRRIHVIQRGGQIVFHFDWFR
jgi:hypothetical protein